MTNIFGKEGSSPFFSVILPVYNHSKLVARALQSVRMQKFSEWECCVVDDGSSDDTYAVVTAWAEQDERIRVYRLQKNCGPAVARNVAAVLAQGQFLTFLDADDWYHPSHLLLRWEYIKRYPMIPWFWGGVRVLGDPYVPDLRNPQQLIHIQHCVVGGTFVVAKAVFSSLGGFPAVSYGEDAQLYRIAQQKKIPMKYVAEPTYVYDRTVQNSRCWGIRKLQSH